MTIEAKIINDSISEHGNRLTTMQLRYPRFIHAEFMTHRQFSRNASSSRAIPVERMLKAIKEDPAMPEYWGSNKPGMQAGAEVGEAMKAYSIESWLAGCTEACDLALELHQAGLHKQIVNRVTEPWQHINVVVTSSEWSNFFALRRHEDAQPEIHVLADRMYEAHLDSKPYELQAGDFHLPYMDEHDIAALLKNGVIDDDVERDMIKMSVARCARVSYLTHDGKPTTREEDVKLYDRLVGGHPIHASPAEHQAMVDGKEFNGAWSNPELHGNFTGWIQYRKTLEGECQ